MVMIIEPTPAASGKSLTLKEAAVLAAVTEKVVRHELAARVIRPIRRRHRRVELPPAVVLYLALVARLPVELPKAERRDLFELLARGEEAHGNWTRSADRLVREGPVPIALSISDLDRDVADRLRLFSKGMKRVHSAPERLGGEPVFVGTRVSVRHVGQLVKRGVSRRELREDFPELKEDDFEFAQMFAELGARPGRPRKLKLVRQ